MITLQSLANPDNLTGMARYGINTNNALGVTVSALREIGNGMRGAHIMARDLWNSAVHEARILACIIYDPQELTEEQMEKWVHEFDSWDICDQVCNNLFVKSPIAYDKAIEWSGSSETYVKRA